MTVKKVLCLLVGFSGVVLALGLDGGGDMIGYLAGFASITFFAVNTILMQQVSRGDAAECIQFYNALLFATVGAVVVLAQQAFAPVDWVLALILAAGVINIAGSVFYNVAIQNTGSINVAQLHYTQIIFGAVFGYFLWGEIPTWGLVLGTALIIGSGLVVAVQARREVLWKPQEIYVEDSD
ncbi:MAG: DMT family transporter [Alphaproteobacteria bacterium]|nr:DMT family transporter [Alphaproteobacteria bacterium]